MITTDQKQVLHGVYIEKIQADVMLVCVQTGQLMNNEQKMSFPLSVQFFIFTC